MPPFVAAIDSTQPSQQDPHSSAFASVSWMLGLKNQKYLGKVVLHFLDTLETWRPIS